MTSQEAIEIIRNRCETPHGECETVWRNWRGWDGWPKANGAHSLITHVGNINRGIDGKEFDPELVELITNLRNNA